MRFKKRLFLWCKAGFSAIITALFTFSNHCNMVIWFLRTMSYYYQRWKPLIFCWFIFLQKYWYIFFQDSLMNKKLLIYLKFQSSFPNTAKGLLWVPAYTCQYCLKWTKGIEKETQRQKENILHFLFAGVGLQIYKMLNLGSNVIVYKLKKLCTLCFSYWGTD